MRLSISNIAWDTLEDEEVSKVLQTLSVTAIDIAPGKYFPNPSTASSREISDVRDIWRRRQLDIVGMQSLLFGLQGLNIFGPPEQREKLAEHLRHTCRIASALGATRLVFGSPRNRDRGEMNYTHAEDIALNFFAILGDIASSETVTICLEANPPSYGCNFITSTNEAITFVHKLNHPSIRLQLDTGTILANDEDPSLLFTTLSSNPNIVGHIHISEPQLVPPGDARSKLAHIIDLICRHFPDRLATIEMLATPQESHMVSIERAIRWVQRLLQPDEVAR
jgi:sugar phosphate isomerase/epimerase